ncbi:MAG: CapA family protein [Bdellovibrionota bacterium]
MSRPIYFLALALAFATNPSRASVPPRAIELPAGPDSLTIAAVGDVLLHSQLQRQAYSQADGFQKLWRSVTPLLKAADFSYANLEGPAAGALGARGRPVKDPGLKFDNVAYSSYPQFNYHPKLVSELKRGGIDLVSTANNHAMDRASLGVDRTIDALNAAHLPFTGTRTAEQAANDQGDFAWHVVTKIKGWNVAWIACTFSTNGISDRKHQVLRCFEDSDIVESEIRALHRDPAIDAVIVTPHWGEVEYAQKVEHGQRALAQRFAEAGAAALLGNHPHVTKPWEKLTTTDGRECVVVYSIGNFVSAQKSLAERTSALVYLGLSRSPGKKAWVSTVKYVPLYMLQHPFAVVPADTSKAAPQSSIALLEKMLGKSGRLSSRLHPLAER